MHRSNDESNQRRPNRLGFYLRVVACALFIAFALLAAESVWHLPSWTHVAVVLFPTVACAITLIVIPLLAMLSGGQSSRSKLIALLLGIVCAAVIAEGGATFYYAGDRYGLETLRARWLGITPPVSRGYKTPIISQPYLLYVSEPGKYGPNLHNEQGYRGQAVPMLRTDGVTRVLCMGGSTTYGTAVPNANNAYPAQLEKILRNGLPAGVQDVQVINAGVSDATSAELVTHYHFKFHYYQPDLVIINTGGNDAGYAASTAKFYQPDYSHARQSISTPQPLPWAGRVLVRSRFASWVLTNLLYTIQSRNIVVQRPEDLPPPTRWHPAAIQPGLVESLSDAELSFTHNLNTLLDLCQKDGAKVLLVPFRLAPGRETDPHHEPELRHERILTKMAEDRGIPLAPFPAHVIEATNWVDVCHLNEEGCQQKARHIAPHVAKLLWPTDATSIEE